MRNSFAAAPLVLGVATGCSSAPQAGGPQPTASNASAIQGGTTDTTHSFAVGIVVVPNTQDPQEVAFCSGALLAPNLVATARHCAADISSTQIDCSNATFGADYAPNQIMVTTDATISQSSKFLAVSRVVTPTPTAVCGDDLALLILANNVNLPAYVTPVLSPPMTDHSAYSESITAIGYGIDSPTDTKGTSAGTRRILQNIPLTCIPNDPTLSCPPQLSGVISPNEFQASDGTCEGDSGSSAYDEKSFDVGDWKSFGVLSRGGVSQDGTTCEGAIYTQFDAWTQLVIQTATQAAQMGGYAPPGWTGAAGSSTASSSSTSSSSSSGGMTSGGTNDGGPGGSGSTSGGANLGGQGAGGAADGASCSSNAQCTSNNCVTADNGKTYFCASSCMTSSDCGSGSACEQGFCIATSGSSAGNAEQLGGSGGKSGCSIAAALGGPTDPVPWRAVLVGMASAAAWLRRRRRR